MSQSSERDTFTPSKLNQFLNTISKLPGPRWLNYLLLPAVLFVISHAVVFLLDPSQAWKMQSEIANILFWLAFSLIAQSDLMSSSHKALEVFRASLQVEDEEFSRIHNRFIHLPRGWGWLILPAFGFSILFTSFRPSIPAPTGIGPVFNILMIVLATITFTTVFHLMAKVILAIQKINKLYARIKTINIFDLQDLYALSALSARIGIVFIIAGTLSYIINIVIPGGEPQIELAVFFISLNTVMATLLFLLPLLGIHRKLEQAKQQVARENNHVLMATLRKLHERSQQSHLDEMPLIESQVKALMEYRQEIDKISTWPWQPQTLRNFITAISLPIVVWLIQQLLGQVIGG